MNQTPNTSLAEATQSIRSQAMAECGLIDISPLARMAGIDHPTAVTPGVWLTYSEPELEITTDPGLFWDLVWMLRCSFTDEYPCRREITIHGDTRWFDFHSLRRGEAEPVLVTIKATRAPGNDGQLVFTLRLPEEN